MSKEKVTAKENTSKKYEWFKNEDDLLDAVKNGAIDEKRKAIFIAYQLCADATNLLYKGHEKNNALCRLQEAHMWAQKSLRDSPEARLMDAIFGKEE
ncbi:hypothetical protein [Atopobium deltae]|uniref:Uncharacterized protein n=1 Tax=Atopobium deltae TaxID=1393034 RepID=A0A133XPD0_9ACTN|nr:hypothetical protein [Atopobium deltae]KXB32792.1 hypothetical protein HMPREF3192_01472 [Atopobium deltae]